MTKNIDVNHLTKNQLAKLRKEITLFSLFINDYKNSLGIKPEYCCNFFEGYAEYITELLNMDPICYKLDFYETIDKFDTTDNLYNYYCSCEYPFGDEIKVTGENC